MSHSPKDQDHFPRRDDLLAEVTELRSAIAARDAFLATAAHELRTP